MAVPEKSDKKRKEKQRGAKENERTSADLSSIYRGSQTKCRLLRSRYIKRIKYLLLAT